MKFSPFALPKDLAEPLVPRVIWLIQHHMAHPTWDLRQVHQFHRYVLKWGAIGYNYWIDFDGTTYRTRGLRRGRHTKGYNECSLGIGYRGDFDKQVMNDAQFQAGVELNQYLLDRFRLPISAIVPHARFGSTTCPGRQFPLQQLIESLRSRYS